MLNKRDLIANLPFYEDQKKRQQWLKIQGKNDMTTLAMNELYKTEAEFIRDIRIYSDCLNDLITNKHYSKKDRMMLNKQKEMIDKMIAQHNKVGFFDLLSKAHNVDDLRELIMITSRKNIDAYFEVLGQLTILHPQMSAFTAKLGKSDIATFLNNNAIKPIQRGPRYGLLAQQMEKYAGTPPLEMEKNAETTPLEMGPFNHEVQHCLKGSH